MKNIAKVAAAVVIVAVVLISIMYSYNQPHTVQSSVSSTTTVTAPSAITITPASVSAPACPYSQFYVNLTLGNFAGFTIYNSSGYNDYLIAPGNTGTISYAMQLIRHFQSTNQTTLNVTNQLWFLYNASDMIHSSTANPAGMNVSYSPENATLALNQTANFNVTLSTAANSPLGTYLVEFPPGICFGGRYELLTVGTTPYNGIVHVIYPA